jgi:hypothetical protein
MGKVIGPYFAVIAGNVSNTAWKRVQSFGFCYVIFNSHMFNAPRFNSEKDVSLQKFLI